MRENQETQFENIKELVTPAPEGEENKEGAILDDHEHVVDIEAPEIQEKIIEAKELFEKFYEKYAEEFDLADDEKIERVIEAAEKENIFTKAKKIRELIFGKNISIYGVCYLSNKCGSNYCVFCPMGQMCRKKWSLENNLRLYTKQLDEAKDEGYKENDLKNFVEWNARKLTIRKLKEFQKKIATLTPSQATKDMAALAKVGHQEICVLAGEELASEIGPDGKRIIKSSNDPFEVAKYVQIALDQPGVKEVILNIGAFSENVFRAMLESLEIPSGVKLQFRVFQETYDPKEYDYYLRYAPQDCHNKRDYKFRYDSQVVALKAGFDEVGIGALFGLSQYPLKEIAGLEKHSQYIKENGGKEPKRCCLPLANDPGEIQYDHVISGPLDLQEIQKYRDNLKYIINEQGQNAQGETVYEVLTKSDKPSVEVKHMIAGKDNQEKITELIYALARLAMPTISIVSSERDDPELLKKLDQYANHTTLFVHPYPGGNTDAVKELENTEQGGEKPIGQAKTFSRQPQQAIADWQKRGYNILGFETAKYGKELDPETSRRHCPRHVFRMTTPRDPSLRSG